VRRRADDFYRHSEGLAIGIAGTAIFIGRKKKEDEKATA
jgi:hypothetical protein